MQSPVLCVVHLALGCVQILDQGMVAPVCLLNTCDDGRKLPPREVGLGKPGRQPRCQDSQQEQPCELQANVLLATIPSFTSDVCSCFLHQDPCTQLSLVPFSNSAKRDSMQS